MTSAVIHETDALEGVALRFVLEVIILTLR